MGQYGAVLQLLKYLSELQGQNYVGFGGAYSDCKIVDLLVRSSGVKCSSQVKLLFLHDFDLCLGFRCIERQLRLMPKSIKQNMCIFCDTFR